jgi:hypothetical protein
MKHHNRIQALIFTLAVLPLLYLPGEIRAETGVYKKGAETPKKAWEIIVSKWNGEDKYENIDVYTEAAKLIDGDQNSKNHTWADKFQTMQYEIIRNGDYAIVSFGKKKGHRYSPVLLMRTPEPEGWKIDFAGQRKYVVSGGDNGWSLEVADHPYAEIATYGWTSSKKDFPPGYGKYNAETDRKMAERYRNLSKEIKKDPENFEISLELGALGTEMALTAGETLPFLQRAMRLDPDNPEPHKYMAIRLIEDKLDYDGAFPEIASYINKGGDWVFGYNFLGFVYMQKKFYDKAIKAFDISLEANRRSDLPENNKAAHKIYSYQKLARCHELKGNDELMREYLEKMRQIDPDNWRVKMYGH